jgi:hypothetical protein
VLEVLEEAARGMPAITSLAEESRPPASLSSSYGAAMSDPCGWLSGWRRAGGRGAGAARPGTRVASERLPQRLKCSGQRADTP